MTLTATIESKRLYTNSEFEALVQELPGDNLYELIDGEIVMAPPPGDEHGGIAEIIHRRLVLFDPEAKLGRIRESTRYEISPGFTPAPDLGFIKAERLVPVVKGAVPIRPDLAVEVLSPSDLESQKRRDATKNKIRRYQTGGVPIVWVINPQTRTVEVYHPDHSDPVETLGVSQTLDGSDLLPGFTLPVKSLFE